MSISVPHQHQLKITTSFSWLRVTIIPTPKIKINTFLDHNKDGIRNNGEPFIKTKIVLINSKQKSVFYKTKANGTIEQWIEKGMFIETSTRSSMSPLDINRERPLLARLFMNKYGIEIDPNRMNESYFKCENVRIWGN